MINEDKEDIRLEKYKKSKKIDKMNSKDVIDFLYHRYCIPSSKDLNTWYVKYYQTLDDEFDDLDMLEANRIFRVNKQLNEFTKNPLISIHPLIINLEYYKIEKQKDYMDNFFVESGFYVVSKILKNVIALDDKSEFDEKIRVLLPEEITTNLRIGDRLELTITRKLFALYWDIIKVKKCYPYSAFAEFERKW